MLHPEAGEDLNASVVHHHRDMHDHFACWVTQYLPQPLIQVEFLGRKVKSSSLSFPWINLLLEGYGLHNKFSGYELQSQFASPAAVEPFAPGRDGAGTSTGRNRALRSFCSISAPGEPYARMRPLGRDLFLVLTPNLSSICVPRNLGKRLTPSDASSGRILSCLPASGYGHLV